MHDLRLVKCCRVNSVGGAAPERGVRLGVKRVAPRIQVIVSCCVYYSFSHSVLVGLELLNDLVLFLVVLLVQVVREYATLNT